MLTLRGRLALAAPFAAAALAHAIPARAIDPFELQVYTPDVNRVYHFGLELHSIAGFTAADPAGAPELHETLEPSFGLPHGFEIGSYFQTAWTAAHGPDFAGLKWRLKWHAPLAHDSIVQLGVNVELSYIPARYDPAVWGSELRPIIQLARNGLELDLNPIFTFEWTGPNVAVPQFEPCVAARYTVEHAIAFGVEYYGTLGPVTHIEPLGREQHYLFGTLNVTRWESWEMHVGIGGGLTPASQPVLFKLIVGHEF